jgi:hypothetical protein
MLFAFLCTLLFNACKKEVVYVEKEPVSLDSANVRFLGFRLNAKDNPEFINDNIVFNVENDVITARVPYYTNLKSLTATFQTDADSIFVDGVAQLSGKSINDFSKPVTYELMDKAGKLKKYTVQLLNFTGLPVIRIYTETGKSVVSKDDYLKADIKIDGAGKFADYSGKMKIKGRGNSTWELPKKPYKMKFDAAIGLLNGNPDKEWVLLANYNDKSSLRTDAAYFLGAQSQLDWTPKANFVDLFVNDVYLGNYQLSEGINVSESRVNVGKNGYLLEVDQLDRMAAEDVYFFTKRILLNIKEPGLAPNDEQFNYVKTYLNDAENALYGAAFKDEAVGYRKYLDVESFVDWYLINEIAKNNDAIFFSSCYMNLVPGGKLKMGPIWDFDIAFGNINYNDNQHAAGFYVKNSPWISRLFEDPAFVTAVKARFAYFKNHKLALLENINQKSVAVKWSMQEDNNKWNTLYNNNYPNYAVVGSYNNEVQYLKDWINKRFNWLDQEFAKL